MRSLFSMGLRRTHPLPRGGTDCVQAHFVTFWLGLFVAQFLILWLFLIGILKLRKLIEPS